VLARHRGPARGEGEVTIMKPQTRLRQWWDSQLAATVRPDIVMTALQKAGDQGLTLEELVAACPGSSRSKVDRALRRLRAKSLVEKNGDRWRVPKAK
jgi:hypothetical protein